MGRTARNDRYFFQLHGLKADTPASLNKALAQAIRSMRRSVYSDSARELTAAELEVLKASGADPHEQADLPDPMGAYAAEFAAILETSLSTSAAAKRLGVHSVRIRQLIGDRSLYAVQIDSSGARSWCRTSARSTESSVGSSTPSRSCAGTRRRTPSSKHRAGRF